VASSRGSAGLFSVAGKTVLVTGGSRGIGEMIASGFAEAGVELIIIASRKTNELEAAAQSLGRFTKCVALQADVSSAGGARELAAAVAQHTDVLHVLVNNAGTVWAAPIEEYPESGFEKVVNTNLKGPFFLTTALLPLLRAAAVPDDPARVINIGSVDGERPLDPDTYAYGASKAAVHMLTRQLAQRLGSEAITVNAIAPGVFPTKLNASIMEQPDERAALLADIPLGRFGCGADLAGTSLFLASRAGAYLTGAVIPVDGGWATST
jgi:NAD(P)-dependent dehydrogenase (short-subunit alcohol dehydrogenase family)